MSENITQLIYSDDDINEVTSLQSNLYDEIIGFDEYLGKALSKLQGLLKGKYSGKYIFGKLYYREDIDSFLKKDFYNDPSNFENQIFHNGIKPAEALVENKSQISLSIVLIDGFLRGIILHKGTTLLKPEEDTPGLIYFNYTENSHDIFDKYVGKATTEKINNILRIHSEMADKCEGEIYSYLIRTRNFDRDYNGSIYLVFKQPLQIAEYSRIVDFFTHIMHAKIKYDYKRERNAEWKRVIEQITHSKYNQRAIINDNAKEFAKELKSLGLYEVLKKFEQNEVQRQSLDVIDDFFFALNKVDFKKSNFDNLAEGRIKDVLNPENINLSEAILKEINRVKLSLHVIPFNKIPHRKKVSEYLSILETEFKNRFQDVIIVAANEGFRIILLDMLKNAVRFTDDDNPLVNIELYPTDLDEIDEWQKEKNEFTVTSETYMTLAFTNNHPIVQVDKKDYNNLLGKIISDQTSNTSQLGLRTIRTITKYDGLGKSGLRWFYTPSKECLKEQQTKVLLLIPKADFHYGI
jgi:hypothetical protein